MKEFWIEKLRIYHVKGNEKIKLLTYETEVILDAFLKRYTRGNEFGEFEVICLNGGNFHVYVKYKDENKCSKKICSFQYLHDDKSLKVTTYLDKGIQINNEDEYTDFMILKMILSKEFIKKTNELMNDLYDKIDVIHKSMGKAIRIIKH